MANCISAMPIRRCSTRQLARAAGGRLLLRIEDIDTTRCTPEFEAGIYRDLEWLGLEWEEPVRRQSEHFADYQAVLDRLIREELVYPAFMSRGEIRAFIADSEKRGRDWPRDPDGVPLYPAADKALPISERKRRIAENAPFAWRLDVDAAHGARRHGSVLARICRRDTVGDATQSRPGRRTGATSSWRAAKSRPAITWPSSSTTRCKASAMSCAASDLYSATGIQRLLQELLGLRQPAYFHHRLILGPDGRKLSKSLATPACRARQAATPDDVRRWWAVRSDREPALTAPTRR